MTFNESKPIYLQITDYISDRVISNVWKEGDRIPSTRELGGDLEVNPNTVMRSYEWLSERNIIFNRRGIGFFISSDALKVITDQRKKELMDRDLRSIAQTMTQLGVTIEEVNKQLERLLVTIKEEKQ